MFVKRYLNNGIGMLLYAGHLGWGIIPSSFANWFRETWNTSKRALKLAIEYNCVRSRRINSHRLQSMSYSVCTAVKSFDTLAQYRV